MAARRVAGHVIPVCTKASKELSEVRDRIRKVRRDISHMPESLELSDLADQVTRLSVKLDVLARTSFAAARHGESLPS